MGLYNEVMQRLFGTGDQAAGITMVRFPIGSCDFSLKEATYDDDAGDYALSHFAVNDDGKNIIATLKDAKAINKGLQLMGSPWSPPAWLKTKGTLDGKSIFNDN